MSYVVVGSVHLRGVISSHFCDLSVWNPSNPSVGEELVFPRWSSVGHLRACNGRGFHFPPSVSLEGSGAGVTIKGGLILRVGEEN